MRYAVYFSLDERPFPQKIRSCWTKWGARDLVRRCKKLSTTGITYWLEKED